MIAEGSSVKTHGINASVLRFEDTPDGASTQFVLEVDKDGFHWELRKRFSEFHFLFTNVQEHCRSMRASFPPKMLGKLSPAHLEERQQRLNAWLTEFLDTVPMTAGMIAQLRTFFQVEQFTNAERRMISSRRIDIPTRTSPGYIIKAGYLTKLGGNKQGGQGNWKRRYTVLQDDLKYYDSEQAYLNGGQPKGIVNLKTFYVTYGEAPNTSWEFTVHALPWPLTCRAESEEEMRAWVQTLQNLCDIVS